VNYHGDLWGDLRAMRSNPAGYAATDDARRAVFLAALEQSEQLLRSARGLGYATRPLNLFYGLSQAGRAISAAWCPPEQGAHQSWRLSSHGIKARALTGEMEAITVVGDHMSKKLHKDSPRPTFSGVAAALGSDTMTQPTSLLDLWACLPEAIGRPARGDDGRFGPVQIQQPSFLPQDAETTVGAVAAWTHNWPVDQLHQWERAGWETFNSRVHAAVLAHYPTMSAPATNTIASQWPTQWLGRRGSVRLTWSLGENMTMLEADWGLTLQQLPYRDEHWAFPAPHGQQLQPLVIWWAVLFALSMLARYESERWLSVVDVNSSVWATPLEHLLDQALDAVPEVIAQALTLDPIT